MLNDLQGAYRHCRSVEHILLYAVDTITQALNNRDSVCAAFLDLRKAFDSLDHCLLFLIYVNNMSLQVGHSCFVAIRR